MRTLLVMIGASVIAVPLMLQAQVPGQSGDPDAAKGVFGPVDALGQAIRRPPPPTGPPPRLPDGTIDLGDGLWLGGGPGIDMAVGLPKGESFPLLPWAKALMEDRAKRPGDDPFYWCMPMGVPRVTPYPYRFVQNYTIKPTHMYILHEGTIHTYRQIFMDGRKHPPELEPSWFGHSIGAWDKDTLVIDTVGYNDKFWFDRRGTPHTEQLHTIERWTRMTKGHDGQRDHH